MKLGWEISFISGVHFIGPKPCSHFLFVRRGPESMLAFYYVDQL